MKRVIFTLAMLCIATSAFAQARMLFQKIDSTVNLTRSHLGVTEDTIGKTGYVYGVKAGGGIGLIVSGGSVTTPISIANGGTNATTAQAARNNLLPSQGSNAGKVLQTDGTNVTWVILPVAGGGTGASTAAGARVNILPDTTGQTGKKLTIKPGGGFDWE